MSTRKKYQFPFRTAKKQHNNNNNNNNNNNDNNNNILVLMVSLYKNREKQYLKKEKIALHQ